MGSLCFWRKKKLVVTIQFKIQEEILWIKFAENIEIKGSDNEISTQEEERWFFQCVLSQFNCVRLFATPWTLWSLPSSSVHRILQARIME